MCGSGQYMAGPYVTLQQKMCFKVLYLKNVFSGAVAKLEKKVFLKYPFSIFVTVPNKHQNTVTV